MNAKPPSHLYSCCLLPHLLLNGDTQDTLYAAIVKRLQLLGGLTRASRSHTREFPTPQRHRLGVLWSLRGPRP